MILRDMLDLQGALPLRGYLFRCLKGTAKEGINESDFKNLVTVLV